MDALVLLMLLGSIHSYFLYPLILMALPKRPQSCLSDPPLPSVSLIITVHNEAKRIRGKLTNTLEIDYPKQLLEIIVASDASSDGTDEIIGGYAQEDVRLIRSDRRKGKENAQRLALAQANGEIIVFSDAATRIPPEAVRRMVANFGDSRIGAVSSEDRFVTSSGTVSGEGGYVRYEMWLRRLETQVNSLVGLSGSFFAVRKELCKNWDTETPSDFNSAIMCARTGCIAVADPSVLGFYPDIQQHSSEYQRKYRTVLRGMASLARQADILNPFNYGLFAFQVWSHKILRWLVPWFMAALLPLSLALWPEGVLYQGLVAAQLMFYGTAGLGAAFLPLRRYRLFKLPLFFVQTNLAIAHAGLAFLAGRRVTVWEPSKR